MKNHEIKIGDTPSTINGAVLKSKIGNEIFIEDGHLFVAGKIETLALAARRLRALANMCDYMIERAEAKST